MRNSIGLLMVFLTALLSRGADPTVPTSALWDEPLRGLPLLASYDVPPTRHNGEVWAFATAGAGRMWVGSDELFLFDGESRESVTLPFETYAVRALAYDASGRLWIGAIGEIGHLEPTATGGWHYVSARAELEAAGFADVRVWEALATPQGVVFVADDQILRWDGSRFEHWHMPSSARLRATRDRDRLWIFQPGVGLIRVEANGPRLLIPAAELPGSAVTWAVGARTNGRTNAIEPALVGGNEGVFRRQDSGWQKLEQLSSLVAGKSPWRALSLNDSVVAIGTALSGVVIGTIDDRVLAVLDRANGLPNESVSSLWLDERSNQLWIGYLGGMSRVDARGSISVFDTRNGLNNAPALKAILHGQRTYVVARRELSFLSPQQDGRAAFANRLPNLPAPLSDALSTGSNLWLGGIGGGIWRVADDTFERKTPIAGFIFALAEAHPPSSELFYVEDTHVRALTPGADGGWQAQDLDAEVEASTISAVRDGQGDLWISTVTNGIVRFRVDNTPTGPRLQLIHRYTASPDLPENVKRPVLTTLGGRVFLFSEQSILGYDRLRDAFVRVAGLEHFVALAGAPSGDPSVGYWIVRNVDIDSTLTGNTALIRLQAGEPGAPPSWDPIDVTELDHAGRISGISFTGGEAPALWIAGSQALLRLSAVALPDPSEMPAPRIRGTLRNGVALPLPAAGTTMQLDSDTTRLRIEVDGIKRADRRPLYVQASLRGVSDEWSKPQSDAAFEFTGLRPGAYAFRARAVDHFGRVSPELTLSFVLARPWYWSTPAVVTYNLIGLLAIIAAVRWRLRHLHRLTERLNRLVDERTGELARANTARNEFLEAVSHEIRNPLNGITNLVDLLHDANLNPEAQKLAGSLGRSAAHLKQVFSDVLGYTKLEYGHVPIEHIAFSLRQLLDDTIALFATQAREQKNDLRLHLPTDFTDSFEGDPDKIMSVVSNYITNGLKYTPGGTIDVAVQVTRPDAEDSTSIVWIGVRDRGPGISAEEQAKLFKKFTRGANAKARGITGTGLGLAICRGVADLLGGKVGVTSEIGQGSTFWLQVPLKRAVQSSPQPASDEPVAHRLPAPGMSDALIVDDQEYNQAVLRGIAQRLGYRTEVAACADEVWPLVERVRFSVVFLDWELPGLSGGEIARLLRQHPSTQDAAIIATTAHDSADIVEKCLDAGMDGFAAKPFDTAQIREVVTSAVERRAGRNRAPLLPPELRPSDLPARIQISLTAFADFAAGDPERARQSVTLYLGTLDQEVSALAGAIAVGDREAIARQAHRLRSHAGLVNGVALNTAAQKLMSAARSDSSDAWRSLTDAVFTEAAALKAEISRLATHTASEATKP